MWFNSACCKSCSAILFLLCLCSCCGAAPAVSRLDLRKIGAQNERQRAIVKAFKHSWDAYRTHCWGQDELLPVSKNCSSEFGGLGVQIVDALDSLWLMGLESEYREAEAWIIQNLSFQRDVSVSAFETTIRVVGGLLSAYFLSSSPELLQKSVDLGHRLLRSWKEGPIPHERVNLKTGQVSASEPKLGSSLAEIGTVQLEMELLSAASGDARFRYRAQHVMDLVGPLLTERGGLLPIMMQPTPPLRWTNQRITLGGRGDSFYEYLLKQWLVTNRTQTRYVEMYQTSVDGIRRAFVGHTSPSNFTFIREVDSASEVDALVRAGDRWQWHSSEVASSHVIPGMFMVFPVADPDPSEASHQAVPDNSASSPTEIPGGGHGLEHSADGATSGNPKDTHESCDANYGAADEMVETRSDGTPAESTSADTTMPAETSSIHQCGTEDGATECAPNSEPDSLPGNPLASPGESKEEESREARSPQDALSSSADGTCNPDTGAESAPGLEIADIEIEIEAQNDETVDSTAGSVTQSDLIQAIQMQLEQVMQTMRSRIASRPTTDEQLTSGDEQHSTSPVGRQENENGAVSHRDSQNNPSASPPSPKKAPTPAFVVMPSLVGNQSCAMKELFLSQSWQEIHKRVVLQYNGSTQLPHHMRKKIGETVGRHLEEQCNMLGKLKMDHLSCFLPGLLALGVMTGAANDSSIEIELAAGLAETCARMWIDTPTGLAPESVFWSTAPGEDKDMHQRAGSLYSALRPEAVESLWYLYVATGDPKWQELGWSIFEKIQLHARVESGGYSGIENVFETGELQRRDRMETFLLSETFKYLFLLFAEWKDQPIDLTKIVMNTEGHLLPVVDPQLQREFH
eukprot:TRINITY_DN72692_c0_g1_i1.p1 TRINITY_DN72692_c0_g1~~TRINITY_DN72692_c0_g1_i1.p1  ORF type:complete len:869 (+),score=118.70 TRINITY_DN72692_c0_g1_i1:35-2608(+)